MDSKPNLDDDNMVRMFTRLKEDTVTSHHVVNHIAL